MNSLICQNGECLVENLCMMSQLLLLYPGVCVHLLKWIRSDNTVCNRMCFMCCRNQKIQRKKSQMMTLTHYSNQNSNFSKK